MTKECSRHTHSPTLGPRGIESPSDESEIQLENSQKVRLAEAFQADR